MNVTIDCNGKTLNEAMREATRKLDKWIGAQLRSDELLLISQGCLPRELAEEMQAHRQHCMAIRDAKLSEMRRDLDEFFSELM